MFVVEDDDGRAVSGVVDDQAAARGSHQVVDFSSLSVGFARGSGQVDRQGLAAADDDAGVAGERLIGVDFMGVSSFLLHAVEAGGRSAEHQAASVRSGDPDAVVGQKVGSEGDVAQVADGQRSAGQGQVAGGVVGFVVQQEVDDGVVAQVQRQPFPLYGQVRVASRSAAVADDGARRLRVLADVFRSQGNGQTVQTVFPTHGDGSADSGEAGAGGDVPRSFHMAAAGSGEVQAAFRDGDSFRGSVKDGFRSCRVCPQRQGSRSRFGQGRAVGQRPDGGRGSFLRDIDFIKPGEGDVLEVPVSKGSLELQRPVSFDRRSGASADGDASVLSFRPEDASSRQGDEDVASCRAFISCSINVSPVGACSEFYRDIACSGHGAACVSWHFGVGATVDVAGEGGASANGDGGISSNRVLGLA